MEKLKIRKMEETKIRKMVRIARMGLISFGVISGIYIGFGIFCFLIYMSSESDYPGTLLESVFYIIRELPVLGIAMLASAVYAIYRIDKPL